MRCLTQGHLDTLKEPGIELATFRLKANPLYLLSHMPAIDRSILLAKFHIQAMGGCASVWLRLLGTAPDGTDTEEPLLGTSDQGDIHTSKRVCVCVNETLEHLPLSAGEALQAFSQACQNSSRIKIEKGRYCPVSRGSTPI